MLYREDHPTLKQDRTLPHFSGELVRTMMNALFDIRSEGEYS